MILRSGEPVLPANPKRFCPTESPALICAGPLRKTPANLCDSPPQETVSGQKSQDNDIRMAAPSTERRLCPSVVSSSIHLSQELNQAELRL
jgi:hypothetical protein